MCPGIENSIIDVITAVKGLCPTAATHSGPFKFLPAIWRVFFCAIGLH